MARLGPLTAEFTEVDVDGTYYASSCSKEKPKNCDLCPAAYQSTFCEYSIIYEGFVICEISVHIEYVICTCTIQEYYFNLIYQHILPPACCMYMVYSICWLTISLLVHLGIYIFYIDSSNNDVAYIRQWKSTVAGRVGNYHKRREWNICRIGVSERTVQRSIHYHIENICSTALVWLLLPCNTDDTSPCKSGSAANKPIAFISWFSHTVSKLSKIAFLSYLSLSYFFTCKLQRRHMLSVNDKTTNSQVEVWARMSNNIPPFYMDMTTYPCDIPNAGIANIHK